MASLFAGSSNHAGPENGRNAGTGFPLEGQLPFPIGWLSKPFLYFVGFFYQA